jgi:hypothetical protein
MAHFTFSLEVRLETEQGHGTFSWRDGSLSSEHGLLIGRLLHHALELKEHGIRIVDRDDLTVPEAFGLRSSPALSDAEG